MVFHVLSITHAYCLLLLFAFAELNKYKYTPLPLITIALSPLSARVAQDLSLYIQDTTRLEILFIMASSSLALLADLSQAVALCSGGKLHFGNYCNYIYAFQEISAIPDSAAKYKAI